MLANEREAKEALRDPLRLCPSSGGTAPRLNEPHIEQRTQPDPSSPLPADPLTVGEPHKLLTAIWNFQPSAKSIRFEVPSGNSQSVILWIKDERHPNEKPHWVILVSGDRSPPIEIPETTTRQLRAWLFGTASLLVIIAGLIGLHRLRRLHWKDTGRAPT